MKETSEILQIDNSEIDEETLEYSVAKLLWKLKRRVSVAESISGGLICHRLTNIPNSSLYFDCGVISYSNESKIKTLEVSLSTLLDFGAVSEYTAIQMAKGIRKITNADIGLSTTGIAGPGGGSEQKPVGLVYIAIDYLDEIIVEKHQFSGTREEIKFQTSCVALELLKKRLLKELYIKPKFFTKNFGKIRKCLLEKEK